MERRLAPRVLAVALAAAAGGGCASIPVIPGMIPTWAADTLGSADLPTPRPLRLGPEPTPAASTPATPAAEPERGYAGGDEEATAWVEAELKDRGLRFGTDGTVASLYAYLRERHGLVPADKARPGDVVFFDLGGRNRCGDHAGVIDEVDPTGRIAFREARAGIVRMSFAHPRQPFSRRAVDGRVLNTFLRIRRPEDPPGVRYLAGGLLCAVGRVIARPDAKRPRLAGAWTERP